MPTDQRSNALQFHHADPVRARAAADRFDAAHPGRRAAQNKAWYAAHPDYKKAWRAKMKAEHPERLKAWTKDRALRRYGLTLADYNAMLASQGGVCAVCLGPPRGRGSYHVDHDHQTGKVRGLLCHHCNTVLGHVDESTDRLAALAAYLERHR